MGCLTCSGSTSSSLAVTLIMGSLWDVLALAGVQRSCDTQLSAHPISMVGQKTAALPLVTGLVFRLTWKQLCLQSSLALTFDLIEPSGLGLKDHSY